MSELQPNRRQGRIIMGKAVPTATLPEVLESPFPERRTLHWVPPDRAMAGESSIVVTQEVLLQTSRHVAQTLEHERGGFLLGNRYRCPNTGREYVVIDQYVEAVFTESTDVSLTFTHEAWGQLDDKMTGKYIGKKLVGWYHSHPRMSLFLSEHDLAIHRERFAEPWMVALVLEPEKHMGGFFVWSDGKIDPNRYVDFYELLEGETRETVIAWKNYEGLDPIQGTAPTPAAVNTLTASVIKGHGGSGPGANVVVPPPPSIFPDWLHGNLRHFGAVALVIVIFFSTLGAVILWPRVKSWWRSNPAAAQQASPEILKNVRVTLEGRGRIDTTNGTITVHLSPQNLPNEVAREMETSVSIDGQEAVVRPLRNESGALLIEATANAKDKVTEIEASGGKNVELSVTGSCWYKGVSHSFNDTGRGIQILPSSEDMNLAFNSIDRGPQTTARAPRQDPSVAQQRQRQQQQLQERQQQLRQQQRDRERGDRAQREKEREQRGNAWKERQEPERQEKEREQQADSASRIPLIKQVNDARAKVAQWLGKVNDPKSSDSQRKKAEKEWKKAQKELQAKETQLKRREDNE